MGTIYRTQRSPDLLPSLTSLLVALVAAFLFDRSWVPRGPGRAFENSIKQGRLVAVIIRLPSLRPRGGVIGAARATGLRPVAWQHRVVPAHHAPGRAQDEA